MSINDFQISLLVYCLMMTKAEMIALFLSWLILVSCLSMSTGSVYCNMTYHRFLLRNYLIIIFVTARPPKHDQFSLMKKLWKWPHCVTYVGSKMGPLNVSLEMFMWQKLLKL